MQLKKSSVIIILVVLIIVTVVAAFFLRPQGKVEFVLAPEEATLSINGNAQTIRNKQVISLSPGTYEISVARDQFSTKKASVTVEKNKVARTVIALDPQTDAAHKIIESNPESVKITQEYKELRQSLLFKSLPLSGVNYSVEACSSVKYPTTDKKALCITSPTFAGEETAKLYILQLGFNVDDYEVLTGKSTLKTLIKTDTYKIESYANDPADRPQLYITPLNVPYVPPNAPRNEQLESIRIASLDHLEKEGYIRDNYVIIFSNVYLSRYSADVHNHGEGVNSSLE
ncbi:MAG TPA: hypothetical protein VGO98_00575 [Candidatus Saccharimonadales bacterium]|jgi:hypothetical protein|nr:hypothetical protein [Candidatus Saccharimonadales bacterium]